MALVVRKVNKQGDVLSSHKPSNNGLYYIKHNDTWVVVENIPKECKSIVDVYKNTSVSHMMSGMVFQNKVQAIIRGDDSRLLFASSNYSRLTLGHTHYAINDYITMQDMDHHVSLWLSGKYDANKLHERIL